MHHGITGGTIVSFAQGLLKDNYNWSIAFILPLLCYGYILFFGLSGYKSQRLMTADQTKPKTSFTL